MDATKKRCKDLIVGFLLGAAFLGFLLQARLLFTCFSTTSTTVSLDQSVAWTPPLHNNGKVPSSSETSCLEKPARRYDSSDATVVAMARGYDLKAHRMFVGSLRRTGFSGTIMVAMEPDPSPEVEAFLFSMNVTVLKFKYVECKTNITRFPGFLNKIKQQEGNTCIHPYPEIKVRWSRFPFLRDAIQACKQCTGPVLATDYRDVFFQRDPVGDGAPEITGLQLFAEHPRFIKASNRFVRGRLEICRPHFKLTDRMSMICSGTTIGTRDAMIQYMTALYHEMLEWQSNADCYNQTWHGGDQAVLNYLYHSGGLDHLNPQVLNPREGIVNTVGAIAIKYNEFLVEFKKKAKFSLPGYFGETKSTWISAHYDLTDHKGFFLDFNGERSRVVHQFDRFNNFGIRYLYPDLA